MASRGKVKKDITTITTTLRALVHTHMLLSFHPCIYTHIQKKIQGIDFTVAVDQSQYNMGSCGMCIELTGHGYGAGGNPVNGTYIVSRLLRCASCVSLLSFIVITLHPILQVYANNLCPECEWGHLDFALPGDGKWEIAWYVSV